MLNIFLYEKILNLFQMTEKEKMQFMAGIITEEKSPELPHAHDDDRMPYAKDREKKDSTLPENVLDKIENEDIGEVFGLRIIKMNGEEMRNKVDIDYCLGGNSSRYAYTPEGELWAEQFLTPTDFTATIIHELIEHLLMQGKDMSYDTAHEKASSVEIAFRKKVDAGDIKISSFEGVADVVKSEAIKCTKEVLDIDLEKLTSKEK